ncbi:MAG: hypothetical protein HYU41_12170 [Candidatus Rokubacteria bacterium]|nr:hypothetical protein [Candidatus Rokubacteria bacterium]
MDANRLDELRRDGRMRWLPGAHAWSARPDDVMDALAREGYAECKREIARRGPEPSGGVWQGLDTRTGSTASAVWVRRPANDDTIVFIEIDGRPIVDE